MSDSHARPDPDAAFFEDWSEWDNLGGGMVPPRRYGGKPHSAYWCVLHHRVPALGNAPGFALRVPSNQMIHTALARCGAVRDRPSTYASSRSSSYDGEAEHRYYIPAAQWRQLRAELPGIKAKITAQGRNYGY